MDTQLNKKIASIVSILLFAVSAVAFADNQDHPRFHKEMKKVFEACAQANGIALPAQGSGQELSSADRTTVHSCVESFHQSVKACLQSAGISKPEPGQKPSDADKAAFKQCGDQALAKITGGASSSPSPQ